MAGDSFYLSLHQKPYIINTSRGAVVDLASLIGALGEQKISGAALDVLENEQLSTYSGREMEQLKILASDKRVIITPHIAGYSHEAFLGMSKVLLQKLGI